MPRPSNQFKSIPEPPAAPPAAKRRKKEKKTPVNKHKGERLRKISGLFLLVLSFYLLLAFTSFMITWKSDFTFAQVLFDHISWSNFLNTHYVVENWMGKLGTVLSYLFIHQWFGISSFLFIILFFIVGLRWLAGIKLANLAKAFAYILFAIVWISLFMGFLFPGNDVLMGLFGYQLNVWMDSLTGKAGSGFILFFTLLSFLIIVYNLSFHWLQPPGREPGEPVMPAPKTVSGNSKELIRQAVPAQKNVVEFPVSDKEEKDDVTEEVPVNLHNEQRKEQLPVAEEKTEEKDEGPDFVIEQPKESEPEEVEDQPKAHYTVDDPYDHRLDLGGYKFPPLDLLNDYKQESVNVNKDELEANKNKIVETLKHYSIGIQRIKATVGPAVTLYEIVPDSGIKISKIKSLENDIAMSLAAVGIRIIAPIPGKGTIGIEVANQNPEIVPIRSILDSDRFRNSSYDLPIGLGKTISNEPYIADLARMPHLLMAGATGQGKSVGLNAILTSLLYCKHPTEVKFVLIDPKKVELSLFSKIERHYLAKLPDFDEAIITDTRKVIRTLNSLVIEMETRYDLLQDAQVKNIKEYNLKFTNRKLNPNDGHHFLPYIVLVVDEFADLIMTAGKEIETPLTRLAQLSRATGIHLIIATQRPSVNIITGTIKANFPARVAFRVISKIDSRTILDSGGADQLIGRGDMLLSTGSELLRLQCAFVDTPEVERVTEFIGSQRAFPTAHLLPEYFDEETEPSKEFDPSQKDEFFEEAARVVVRAQHGSTSLLQRKLKLGYNRAGRIIDQLEAAGIVGPFEGSKAREVKIKDEMALEQLFRDKEKMDV